MRQKLENMTTHFHLAPIFRMSGTTLTFLLRNYGIQCNTKTTQLITLILHMQFLTQEYQDPSVVVIRGFCVPLSPIKSKINIRYISFQIMYRMLCRMHSNLSFWLRFPMFIHLILSTYIYRQTSWLSCRRISASGVTSARVSEQTSHNDDLRIKWIFAAGHHNLYTFDER